MTSRKSFVKLDWLHWTHPSQKLYTLTFPHWQCAAVSQNYLSCCLLGCILPQIKLNSQFSRCASLFSWQKLYEYSDPQRGPERRQDTELLLLQEPTTPQLQVVSSPAKGWLLLEPQSRSPQGTKEIIWLQRQPPFKCKLTGWWHLWLNGHSVLANSRRWWWTGKPGVLPSTGLKTIGHDLVTEKQQQ